MIHLKKIIWHCIPKLKVDLLNLIFPEKFKEMLKTFEFTNGKPRWSIFHFLIPLTTKKQLTKLQQFLKEIHRKNAETEKLSFNCVFLTKDTKAIRMQAILFLWNITKSNVFLAFERNVQTVLFFFWSKNRLDLLVIVSWLEKWLWIAGFFRYT